MGQQPAIRGTLISGAKRVPEAQGEKGWKEQSLNVFVTTFWPGLSMDTLSCI
jgi:hypothetical protein